MAYLLKCNKNIIFCDFTLNLLIFAEFLMVQANFKKANILFHFFIHLILKGFNVNSQSAIWELRVKPSDV